MLILLTTLWISSCADGVESIEQGLSIQTGALRYQSSDTIRFTVTNLFWTDCQLAACNLKLTYWLQLFDGGTWRDHSSINTGPCLALYPLQITLAPNQTLAEQLVLTGLASLAPGKYHIKVQHMMSRQSGSHYAYSNPFEITG